MVRTHGKEMVRKNGHGHDKEKLVVNRCCWLWDFESLRILVQPKDLSMFFTAMKIHTMVRIVKKQNNFIFSLLVT